MHGQEVKRDRAGNPNKGGAAVMCCGSWHRGSKTIKYAQQCYKPHKIREWASFEGR